MAGPSNILPNPHSLSPDSIVSDGNGRDVSNHRSSGSRTASGPATLAQAMLDIYAESDESSSTTTGSPTAAPAPRRTRGTAPENIWVVKPKRNPVTPASPIGLDRQRATDESPVGSHDPWITGIDSQVVQSSTSRTKQRPAALRSPCFNTGTVVDASDSGLSSPFAHLPKLSKSDKAFRTPAQPIRAIRRISSRGIEAETEPRPNHVPLSPLSPPGPAYREPYANWKVQSVTSRLCRAR